MADALKPLTDNLARMGPGQKIAAATVLASALAGLVVLGLWLQKPDFQVLFSNLSSDDAGAVVAKLREGRVPYELSADGSAVLVPSERVHELRMQLATQGLPQGGGVGFEIFDRSSIGTTEFVQKLNYRRAMQGELARTIGQFAEVQSARVHLVVPERPLFTEAREQSRASVVVNLRPGKQLSQPQVQGIVHLVASSVEGLAPEAVTVVDNRGQVLSRGQEGPLPTGTSRGQLEYQHNLEKDLEAKVQTMLERVVGPGKAVVRVSSTLDLRRVETTEERFDPDTQVARSEQRTQEKQSGSATPSGASGVPGVTSNLPGGTAPAVTGGTATTQSSERNNEVINYELSKTVSRIVEPIGVIKRLSVAVLVDGTYQTSTGPDGEPTRTYVPRAAEDMKKLEDLVKTAMGFSATRQDQVEVLNVPFETETFVGDAAGEAAAPSALEQWTPLIARSASGIVLALLGLLFVVRPLLKLFATAPGGYPAMPQMAELPPSAGLASRPGLPSRDEVLQIAKQNPQATAMVVKKWLKES